MTNNYTCQKNSEYAIKVIHDKPPYVEYQNNRYSTGNYLLSYFISLKNIFYARRSSFINFFKLFNRGGLLLKSEVE